jgi:triosephosphate isomerase
MFISILLSLFHIVYSKKHIVANWKSYLNRGEATALALSLYQTQNIHKNFDVYDKNIIVLPPTLYYTEISRILRTTTINVGAQLSSSHNNGAYTGETTAQSLHSTGCRYCLVGHYERKHYFGQMEKEIHQSTLQLLLNDITPIYCIGETKDDYVNNNSIYTCLMQIDTLLAFLTQSPGFDHSKLQNILFAYEPIWAIGSGIVPNKTYNEQVYYSIHSFITHKYGFNPIILYGGSVALHNLHTMKVYNGLLIGKSSIDSEIFTQICKRF